MREFHRSRLLHAQKQCIHGVTTKDTHLDYAGSLALHTGEDSKSILANRDKVAKILKIENGYRFIVANQTHSDHIAIIDKPEDKGWMRQEDAVANCDALITDQRGVVLSVLTADCVPILLLDTKRQVIGAVHAGWRGTKANIILKTIQRMGHTYGSEPKDIVAFIAPSIGRCCYEVGEDVGGAFDDEETYTRKAEKYMLDLPLINQKQLLTAGVPLANIELSDTCTSCEVEHFFSYRKERGCSGRFMSMIALKP